MALLRTGLAAVVFVVLVYLGNWQVERLAWKDALIASSGSRQQQPALSLDKITDFAALQKPLHDYRNVTARGHYIAGLPPQYWFAQIVDPPADWAHRTTGRHIIQPFQLLDGRVVLVDRGFVPDGVDEVPAPASEVELHIELHGVLRWFPPRSSWDAEDDPSRDFWFVRDAQKMAAHLGIAAAPFFIELARTDTSIPLGGQTRMVFTNNHLGYAITWYGLALALAIVFGIWQLKRIFRDK